MIAVETLVACEVCPVEEERGGECARVKGNTTFYSLYEWVIFLNF